MEKLLSLFIQSENLLIEKLFAYSKQHGFSKYTAKQEYAWHMAIQGINGTLTEFAKAPASSVELSSDESFDEVPATSFGQKEARLHRQRGVTLEMFLSLFKYVRQSYRDVLEESEFEYSKIRSYGAFVDRCFDRIELGIVKEWSNQNKDTLLEELQEANRRAISEKNALGAAFAGIPDALIFLDSQDYVRIMNPAAIEIVQSVAESNCEGCEFGKWMTSGYLFFSNQEELKIPFSHCFPWLQERYRAYLDFGSDSLILEIEIDIKNTHHFFTIKISKAKSFEGTFIGTIIILHDVTKRTMAERKLVSLLSLQRQMFDTAAAWIITFDVNGKILSWNKTAEKQSGYSRYQAVGDNLVLEKLLPDEKERERFNDAIQMTVKTKSEMENFHTTVFCNSGDQRDILWHANQYLNEEGETAGVIAIGIDISEKIRVEKQLQMRADFETVVSYISSLFIGSMEIDYALNDCLKAIGTYCVADRCYLFRLDFGTNLMDNTHEWCAPDVDSLIDYLQELPLNEFPWFMETLANHQTIRIDDVERMPREGKKEQAILKILKIKAMILYPIFVSKQLFGFVGLDQAVKHSPWKPEGITLLEVFASILGSVFERKRSEMELRQSEDRFKTIFNLTPDAYFMMDMNGAMLDGNLKTEEMLGIPKEEFIGKTIRELNIMDLAGAKMAVEALEHHRKGVSTKPTEYTITPKNGRAIPVEVLSTQVEFNGQEMILGTARNVSDRKQMERDLRHAQKMEAIGQLAAGIAHEINTPIQFVGDSVYFMKSSFESFSELLLRCRSLAEKYGGPDDLYLGLTGIEGEDDWDYVLEQMPRAFERTMEGVSRITTIVRSMKEFAHPDRKDKIPADLHNAIKNTINVARNEYKYVADIETHFGEIPEVWCHIGDINQVLLNLIVNAAHAIGDKVANTGTRGTISISTRQDGDYVIISVKDSGTGIPLHVRQRIFEPFFTTKEVGRGTGQGLYISYAVVVEKHNGMLSFETEEGQGTTFHIRLPIHDVVDTIGVEP